jgi:hypothetical protein
VAIAAMFSRQGAVGFIGWLGVLCGVVIRWNHGPRDVNEICAAKLLFCVEQMIRIQKQKDRSALCAYRVERRNALRPEGTSQRNSHHRARDCSIHLLRVRLRPDAARLSGANRALLSQNCFRAPTSVPEICGILIKRRRARSQTSRLLFGQ